MENPLKWMIWGYHYFRKHPYANYHQHGHMMSHGTWQGCLSCAIHLVTRSKKLWTLKMNRFFFDWWGIPRLCLTPFCSVNQLPKQDWSTYHTALQLVRAVWLIFFILLQRGYPCSDNERMSIYRMDCWLVLVCLCSPNCRSVHVEIRVTKGSAKNFLALMTCFNM